MIKIVKENGEIYETPIENLETVRRLIKIKDIIYPDHMIEKYEEEEVIEEKAPKAKTTKKPIKS
jgi:hypothetical protein